MGASEVPTSSSDKWDFSLLTLQHSQQTVTHSSLHSFTQSFQIIITPCGIHSKIFTPSHHPALNQSFAQHVRPFQRTISQFNGGDCFSSNHSADSSFSDGSSATWDSSTVYTPMSTPRRGSPNSVKYENSVYSVPTPSSSPDRYAALNGFSAATTMTQNMVSLFHEPQSAFPGTPNSTSTPNQVI